MINFQVKIEFLSRTWNVFFSQQSETVMRLSTERKSAHLTQNTHQSTQTCMLSM